MPKRVIAPSSNTPPGTVRALEQEGVKFTLFIPQSWRAAPLGAESVVVHFHTVPWFVIQEHLRWGTPRPLVVLALGEGSAVYRQAFEDANRFVRLLEQVARELSQRGGGTNLRVAEVDVSSFSAGYGAVRELVKSPTAFRLIRRIVLLDSMYAGWQPEPASAPRQPLPEQIQVWVPFARAAIRGEKTFVLTHSSVPTIQYASTSACAAALLEALSLRSEAVDAATLPATRDPDFPLRSRADAGKLRIWGYGGTDAQAHLTHARHLADVWQALEAE